MLRSHQERSPYVSRGAFGIVCSRLCLLGLRDGEESLDAEHRESNRADICGVRITARNQIAGAPEFGLGSNMIVRPVRALQSQELCLELLREYLIREARQDPVKDITEIHQFARGWGGRGRTNKARFRHYGQRLWPRRFSTSPENSQCRD
jgi:hypothetical protein